MEILNKKRIILFLCLISSFLCIEEEIPMQGYEIEHIEVMRKIAGECTLFLNKNNEFPLKEPGKLLLAGAGARGTVKGGTGSGDVESRYFTTCEEGLENAGFKIVSKKWLDEFPSFKEQQHKNFINYNYALGEKFDSNAGHMSFGAVEPQPEYELSLDYEADVAIYVIARNSGEGQDRTLVKGDVYLTNSEVRDILYLNEKFQKFMLVLNVAGVVDLSPVKEVSNILLLSELGVVTGDILADIVLGKVNPSGKLSTTWAAAKDYRFLEEFGDTDNTRYLEGVYVGYRYFDSAKVKPLYPFGYGLSYTNFTITKHTVLNNKGRIIVLVNVKNTGGVTGKEVVQLYVSPPQTNKDKPYQSLVAFKKTSNLGAYGTTAVTLEFNLEDVARYDEKTARYVLDKGNYIIRVGDRSDKTFVLAYVNLTDNVVVQQLKNVGGKIDFKDYRPKVTVDDDLTNVQEIKLQPSQFTTQTVDYDYSISFNQKLQSFTDEELGKLCVCNFYDGEHSFVTHLVGEAGETVLTLDKVKKHLVLADGPAGLRIVKKYGIDEKGPYRLCENQMEARLIDYFSPEEWSKIDTLENNLERGGLIYYQYATAIPIATALAQTFSEEVLEKVGDVVGSEMDHFGVNLWLAPGLNIHRNIMNGRNFEYYSEDPVLSGKMAAAITRGVQKHKNRATTIKHFACNSQESNRFNSNSIVSERALREIYLKGFKIAIDESKPYTLMTSYNLINGLHSSQRRDLIIDVLRSEWGYQGLVMSDWYTSNDVKIGIANHLAQHAVPNIKGGNNLQMGGGKNDYDLIMKAVEDGELNTSNLLECASKVYQAIELLNK